MASPSMTRGHPQGRGGKLHMLDKAQGGATLRQIQRSGRRDRVSEPRQHGRAALLDLLVRQPAGGERHLLRHANLRHEPGALTCPSLTQVL